MSTGDGLAVVRERSSARHGSLPGLSPSRGCRQQRDGYTAQSPYSTAILQGERAPFVACGSGEVEVGKIGPDRPAAVRFAQGEGGSVEPPGARGVARGRGGTGEHAAAAGAPYCFSCKPAAPQREHKLALALGYARFNLFAA